MHLCGLSNVPRPGLVILDSRISFRSNVPPMIVMKFGGSSVANAEKIRHVFEIVKGRLPKKPLVICSAFRGVTDDLFKLGDEAVRGTVPSIEPIRKRHQDCLKEMGLDADLLKNLLGELEALLKGISLVKELSPRSPDYVVPFGERLSTRIIAAYSTNHGISPTQH